MQTCWRSDFKYFLTIWQPFVWISNGWASGFQIQFKILTICKLTSFLTIQNPDWSGFQISTIFRSQNMVWTTDNIVGILIIFHDLGQNSPRFKLYCLSICVVEQFMWMRNRKVIVVSITCHLKFSRQQTVKLYCWTKCQCTILSV